MNAIITALRPVISRLCAIAVAALVGLLVTTFQIEVKPEDVNKLVSAAEVLVWAGMAVTYSLVHKFLSRKTNPMDAAAPTASKPSTAVKIGALPPKEV